MIGKTRLADSNEQHWRGRLISFSPYLALALVLLILPPFLPSFAKTLVIKILIFSIFAMSLNLIMGYTGIMSLGHSAFFGVAGYAAGILMVRFGIHSFWVLTPLGILIAAAFAVILGYVALRTSGIYLLLITLAEAQLLSVGAVKLRDMTGGSNGLVGIRYPDIGIPGFTWTPITYHYFVFIIFIICFFLLYRIINSSFGHALVGIRENEPRMLSLGYNTWLHKYVSFILSGAFAGLSGTLYAYLYGIMVPQNLGALTATQVLLMVVIGGPGTLAGPFLGAALILLLENIVSTYAVLRWPFILGSIYVISVIFARQGIVPLITGFWKARTKHGSSEG